MSKLCITARWYGAADSDFYPWLQAELSPIDIAHAVLGPTREAPTVAASAAAVEAASVRLGRTEEIVFLAHSAGCHALLRFLSQLPAGARVAGVVLVAAWTMLDEPWPAIEPWTGLAHDWARVRASSDRITVLLSDDDPFTRDYAQNAAVWRQRLSADVRVLSGRKHYNRPEEPDVLQAVKELVDARR